MKHTKEQLHGMSDFQRNVIIFEFMGGRASSFSEGDNGDIVFENGCILNYCNNPSDIMPLAFEHGISLISPESNGTDEWSAERFVSSGFNNTTVHYDKNPLRAIACCLILVLQGKE